MDLIAAVRLAFQGGLCPCLAAGLYPTPLPCVSVWIVPGSQALAMVSRVLCPMLPVPLVETVHVALRTLPPHPPQRKPCYVVSWAQGRGVWGHARLPLPIMFCLAPSPPASWTAIEHCLLKLGEILANLSNPQLRSQAEQCGTLIRRLGF